MAFVYWISLPTHHNIYSEGYVGITTKTIPKRFNDHKSAAKRGSTKRLYNAIRKYADSISVAEVFEGTLEECLELEKYYRPLKHIGWNHGVGGNAPQSGVKHSPETKAKISASRKGICPDEETRKRIGLLRVGFKYSEESKLKMSESAKNVERLPWKNPRANKEVWFNAESLFTVWLTEKNLTKAAKILSCEVCKLISIFEKFKTGWIPFDDPKWISFKNSYIGNK